MKKKKPIVQNNNTEKIHFYMAHSRSYEIVKKEDKLLKCAFADFFFQKSQLTWQDFSKMSYSCGGFEKCADDMIKKIPNVVLPEKETVLNSTKLDQKYRIIFSRNEKIMVIHYISNHYGDH